MNRLTVPGWQEDANCRDTDAEIFYPETGGSPQPAIRICNSCTVTAECLQYALDRREQFGVWGGKSQPERERILRQQRASGTAAAA